MSGDIYGISMGLKGLEFTWCCLVGDFICLLYFPNGKYSSWRIYIYIYIYINNIYIYICK